MSRFLVLFALLLAPFAGAQTYDLDHTHTAIQQLDGQFRFHLGEDPGDLSRFTLPAFDDSSWALVSASRYQIPAGTSAPVAWYRFQLQASAPARPLALRFATTTNFALYVDGLLLGGCGPLSPAASPTGFHCISQVFHLPAAAPGHTYTVAVRCAPPVGIYRVGTFGDAAAIDALQKATQYQTQAYLTQLYVIMVLELLAIPFAFALFRLRSNEPEYLWFALLLCGDVASYLLQYSALVSDVPSFPLSAASAVTYLTCNVAQLLLFQAIFKARRTLMFYVALAATVLYSVLLSLQYLFPALFDNQRAVLSTFLFVTLVPAVWIGSLVVRRLRARDLNAGILILPVLVLITQNPYSYFTSLLAAFGSTRQFFSYTRALTLHPFPIDLSVLEDLILILALLIVLGIRYTRSTAAQQQLQSDIEAARQVQQLLIPAVPASIPGFHLESVYLPAQEIGGDFFHVATAGDGALLLVVGDVSGKGLSAALTVSVIVGALRAAPEEGPAATLVRLNRALYGHTTGFATCCAARISRDGTATLANAGHLSPYLAGKSVCSKVVCPSA